MAAKTDNPTTKPASYVKKITMASAGFTPRACEDLLAQNKQKKTTVLRIYGRCAEAKADSTDIGPFIKFSGEFEAVNLVDRTKYRSKTLILPQIAENFLDDAIQSVKSSDPNAIAQFGLDITVEENRSTKGGYKFKYGVQPLIDAPKKDALSMIGESLGALPFVESSKS